MRRAVFAASLARVGSLDFERGADAPISLLQSTTRCKTYKKISDTPGTCRKLGRESAHLPLARLASPLPCLGRVVVWSLGTTEQVQYLRVQADTLASAVMAQKAREEVKLPHLAKCNRPKSVRYVRDHDT